MDIAALSSSMAANNLAVKVSTSVLTMNNDLMKQQGQALATLLQSGAIQTNTIEQSVTPYLGGNIDIKL